MKKSSGKKKLRQPERKMLKWERVAPPVKEWEAPLRVRVAPPQHKLVAPLVMRVAPLTKIKQVAPLIKIGVAHQNPRWVEPLGRQRVAPQPDLTRVALLGLKPRGKQRTRMDPNVQRSQRREADQGIENLEDQVLNW